MQNVESCQENGILIDIRYRDIYFFPSVGLFIVVFFKNEVEKEEAQTKFMDIQESCNKVSSFRRSKLDKNKQPDDEKEASPVDEKESPKDEKNE
jgi:hypothetical protein